MYRELQAVLARFSPDLVHLHNTFPLISPAAFAACRRAGIPVVQTLHNYRLLCPNAIFYRDNHLCEDCLGKTFPWPGVMHGCYRDSRSQTTVVASMLAAHRIRGTWTQEDSTFIALTDFARQKFIQGGLPEARVFVKPNFLSVGSGTGSGAVANGSNDSNGSNGGGHEGDFLLFVGRLAPNKGINTMLQAWAGLANPIPLRIVGDGPLIPAVQRASATIPNISYEGRLSRAGVLELMGQARALIFPSEWYECFPLTIVEAFASGLPVIASRLGAMAEIIEDGRSGIYFTPGSPQNLAEKVQWAWSHTEEMRRMGTAGRQEFESKYTAERNYAQLMKIYSHALGANPALPVRSL
jgi:glycosyltransferase involved in cell wall biosynthesis